MPLVTRFANQGNIFKQATEPGDWQDGDLWSDTTNDVLKINVGGTATDIGKSDAQIISLIGDNEKYTLLDSYSATVAESSHAFTLPETIAQAGYSKIIIVFGGEASASQNLGFQVNSITSGYRTTGYRGSSVPALNPYTANSTFFQVATTNMINGSGREMVGEIDIVFNVDADQITFNSYCSCATTTSIEKMGGFLSGELDVSALTMISSANWQIGMTAKVYGVRA